MIRVLLADDHTLVRQGVRNLLHQTEDLRVVAEAQDGLETIAQTQQMTPDVLVVDVRMPRLGGVDAVVELARAGTLPPTLMLSSFDDTAAMAAALHAGARGFLTKQATADELATAVRTVDGGGTYLPHVTAPAPGLPARSTQEFEPLTARERQVLRLMARGLSNREIAQAHGTAEGTVKNQTSMILAKLGVRDRTRAVLRALELRLLD